LIGIGKPRDAQHQKELETQARQRFYASGGNRDAYLAFLPFDSFPEGFFGVRIVLREIKSFTKSGLLYEHSVGITNAFPTKLNLKECIGIHLIYFEAKSEP
jgi:hypothetical protein